jgi:hypothetical protein
MLLTSIRASVSPDTINRVGRLFNNTLPDVLGLCGITSHAFSWRFLGLSSQLSRGLP